MAIEQKTMSKVQTKWACRRTNTDGLVVWIGRRLNCGETMWIESGNDESFIKLYDEKAHLETAIRSSHRILRDTPKDSIMELVEVDVIEASTHLYDRKSN